MSKLNEHATTILIAGIKEVMNNSKYAYISKVNPRYSHLDVAGKEYVIALVEAVLPLLVESQQLQTKIDAEELMLKKLSE